MDKENINTNATNSNVTYMDEVRANLEQARKDGKLDTGMDEIRSAPEREPEVEGITQQGHNSLVKFMARCLVVGLVIGAVIVLFMD